MSQDLQSIIENLSEDQIQEIMDTDFGTDLEKQASDELAQEQFADALYAWGAFSADREFAQSSDDELSKEASDQFEQAEQEIEAAVEAGFQALGFADLQDEVQIHKEAQAAAGLIWQGYADQIEKIAGMKQMGDRVGKFLSGAHKSMKKHPGKSAAIGAGVGVAVGGAAAMAKRHKQGHKKQASEYSFDELSEQISNDVFEKLASANFAAEGWEKLSAAGGKRAVGLLAKGQKALKEGWKSAKNMGEKAGKHVKANKGAYGAGAGLAGGAAAGYAAARKKD